jgi:hemin uptake protein HemP
MNRETINNILKKIDATNTLHLEEEDEIQFYKLFKGRLFKVIIPHRGDKVGLYKLTAQGKSILDSGRNQ